MASNMMENLQAVVQNTAADSIKMIDVDELHESPDNFFSVEHIEELADTILGQGGVKDNLLVVPMKSGGYEIVSGHRRTAAVKLLLDRGESISRYLPCLVQNYWDEDDKRMDMILLNVSSRQVTDAELLKSYEVLDKIFQEKKNSIGKKFGRVREKLAEMLGVSTGQISKIQNIVHNAVPPVVKAVQDGELSLSAANEIAKMDAVSQIATVQNGLENADSQEIKEKQIKRATNGKKIGEKKPPKNVYPDALLRFIHEHYFDLELVLTNYAGISDDDTEKAMLEQFKKLLLEVREHENKKQKNDGKRG